MLLLLLESLLLELSDSRWQREVRTRRRVGSRRGVEHVVEVERVLAVVAVSLHRVKRKDEARCRSEETAGTPSRCWLTRSEELLHCKFLGQRLSFSGYYRLHTSRTASLRSAPDFPYSAFLLTLAERSPP